MKKKPLALVTLVFVVIVCSTMMSTSDALSYWYEYRYESFSDDDYYIEMGWPDHEFTSRFWLHSVATLRRTVKVTFDVRRNIYRETPVTGWFWYKVEHYCRQQPSWDPTTWYKAYTQVYMIIQNYYELNSKWEDYPLGNRWSYVAFPTDSQGKMIPFEPNDLFHDRAFHYSIVDPSQNPNGDPDGDGITNMIFPNP
ncbi:MAG: hypothetical protein ACTSV3_02100 [Candidatus Thorarchaeota archaeon]|nr:MAG: hypothetical protein DRP09_12015 [Candidatus Thorarchaeota archaeon]RLI58091.1 MAG: hypothetical protein DRO87_06265 [Candidatus Thorarchaeota archaeon]